MIYFEKEARTPSSEAYTIWEDGSVVGRLDLHFQSSRVYGTLCTTADANEARILDLIEQADERLVMPADPMREDFIVSVWKGSPGGSYSDANMMESDDIIQLFEDDA